MLVDGARNVVLLFVEENAFESVDAQLVGIGVFCTENSVAMRNVTQNRAQNKCVVSGLHLQFAFRLVRSINHEVRQITFATSRQNSLKLFSTEKFDEFIFSEQANRLQLISANSNQYSSKSDFASRINKFFSGAFVMFMPYQSRHYRNANCIF